MIQCNRRGVQRSLASLQDDNASLQDDNKFCDDNNEEGHNCGLGFVVLIGVVDGEAAEFVGDFEEALVAVVPLG